MILLIGSTTTGNSGVEEFVCFRLGRCVIWVNGMGSGGGDGRSKRMGWNGVTYLYQDCLDEDRQDGVESVC